MRNKGHACFINYACLCCSIGFERENTFIFIVCFQELAAEITEFEKQRDKIEAELKKVSLLPSLDSLL